MVDAQEAKSIAPMCALPPGVRLQEYVIRSVVGEGGFGIVYLAHDTLLDREVAIKEYLPATLASRVHGLNVGCRVASKLELFKKGLRHFVDEAQILARFHHPGLVAVMRFIEANGTAYMIMPYYRGTTLHEMIRTGYRAKTTKDLLSILLPVLEGLSQIHSVKCYHLDVSSDNILIREEDGTPVLLDFGSARHVQEDKTAPSTVFLKPGFASIEQYSETDSLRVGSWTDIYAISALAYLLVTGKMPIISVARVLKDQLVPLSSFASAELPAQLLEVFEAGLSVEPSRRPQNVESFIDSLNKAVLKGEPKQSLPEPDVKKEAKPSFSFSLRPFREAVAKGMAAVRARLPKWSNVQALIRVGLTKISGWGAAARKAALAALAETGRWGIAARKAILAALVVIGGWGAVAYKAALTVLARIGGWGTAACKKVFAALAVMFAGLPKVLARLGAIPLRMAKFTAKMLLKAGIRMKAGMGWLLNVVGIAASKAGSAVKNGMSALQSYSSKFFGKVFAIIKIKPYWSAAGAGALLLAVLLGLFLNPPEDRVSEEIKLVELAPPRLVAIEEEPPPLALQSQAQVQAQTQSETQAQTQSDTQAQAPSQAPSQSQAQTPSQAQAQSQSQSRAQAQTQSQTQSRSDEPALPSREQLPNDVQVSVSVKPWGDIFLNGAKIGTAPPTLNIKASNIAVGPHKIEIHSGSGIIYAQNIVVKRGQRISINHVFK